VLPYAHRKPALGGEASIGVEVASAVAFDLQTPELGVVLWPRRMLRTPVPEAPVDENGEASGAEDDVGLSPDTFDRPLVNSVPEALCVQYPPKR